MNIKKFLLKEQNNAVATTTALDIKDAYSFGCFSKERYPWFVLDEGIQPKTTADNKLAVTGKNSKGQPVFFFLSGTTGGFYKNMQTNNQKTWDCPEALTAKKDKDQFIADFVAKNQDYTGTKPSDFKIGREYKEVDLSTLSKIFKPGERFIYQRIGTVNTRIEQQKPIEDALTAAGYTLTEPPITSPEHDMGMDIRKIMGGKYANYYQVLLSSGLPTIVYPISKGGTSQVTTATPVKDALKKAKEGKLPRNECRKWIKALYTIMKSKKARNDDELMIYKKNVYACYVQDTTFKSGSFGVGDELRALAFDNTKFGIADMIKSSGAQMNESKMMKNIIKENLIISAKKKENKLLSENKIIVSRFNLLSEGVKPKNKRELNKFFDSLMVETAYLHSQEYDKNLIKEGFLDLVKGLFGNASTSIFQYFKEHIARWMVTKFTPIDPDSWMGNIIITSIGNLPLTELHNLTNCNYVSKMLAKDIAEGAVNKIKNEQGLTGPGYDILRNALIEMAEDSTFGQKVEQKISDFICPKLGGLKDKLETVTSSVKSKALDLGDKAKDIANKGIEAKQALVS